jgi:plasmid maintenance system antidote protein VapI
MEELKTYIDEIGGVEPFAKQMGISIPHVYKILTGERKPSSRLALKFEKKSGGKIQKEKMLFGDAA